jgi:Arc/MetJ-type ribon-helix-helix transcriptional regulator
MMKRYNVAMTEQMEQALEKERKKRLLDSIPETIRTILSEYLSKS